jgi:hypothetical protein
MQLNTAANETAMQSMWHAACDLAIAHQIDLLMFLVSLAGYFLLFKLRTPWKPAKDVSEPVKKIDDSIQESIEFLLSVQVAAGNVPEVRRLVEDMQAKETPALLSEDVMNSMLSDSFFVIGGEMISLAIELVKLQSQLSVTTYALLIKGLLYSGERAILPAIIQEAIDRLPPSSISMELINSILDFCRDSPDDGWLADMLLKRLQPAEWSVLHEFIDFYIEMSESEKACDVYELNFATFFDAELDPDTESNLIVAALQCGRCALAEHLCGTSPQNITKSVVVIQRWWRHQAEELQDGRREHRVADVIARLSDVFQDRFPFQERFPFEEYEERSDDESTAFLGDDDDLACFSDLDSNEGESEWDL